MDVADAACEIFTADRTVPATLGCHLGSTGSLGRLRVRLRADAMPPCLPISRMRSLLIDFARARPPSFPKLTADGFF